MTVVSTGRVCLWFCTGQEKRHGFLLHDLKQNVTALTIFTSCSQEFELYDHKSMFSVRTVNKYHFLHI